VNTTVTCRKGVTTVETPCPVTSGVKRHENSGAWEVDKALEIFRRLPPEKGRLRIVSALTEFSVVREGSWDLPHWRGSCPPTGGVKALPTWAFPSRGSLSKHRLKNIANPRFIAP